MPAPAAAATVTSVGQRLRAAREAAHLTLAEVADSLKFSPRQIELLEADDHAALPGNTAVRGFVRGYARLLNLDAADLLHGLDAYTPIAPDVRAPDNMGVATGSGPRQLSPLVSAAIVLALAALLLGLWHFFVPSSAETIAAAGSRIWSVSQLFQAPAAVPVVAPREAEPSFPPLPLPAVAGAAPESNVAAVPSAITGPALHFVFQGRSWLEVTDAARQKLHSGENPAGSRLTITGQPPFDIVIGNAGKVALTYGERVIDLAPYTRAEVARLTLE